MPTPREFAFDDAALQERLPAALQLLQFVIKYGGILARTAVLLGVVATGFAALMAWRGISDTAKATGGNVIWVGLAVLAQGIVIVGAVRHLRRAELAPDYRVRPALLTIAIAGAPFLLGGLAFGAFVIWSFVAGPVGELKPKALLMGAAVVFVWAGVPAVAGYGLIKHRAVWDAMDAESR